MESVVQWLSHRERTSCSIAKFRDSRFTLRTYHLFRIIPQFARYDVFLGFSICGNFLVSFKTDVKKYILRFWLFPPTVIYDGEGYRLDLFAEIGFSRVVFFANFQDNPCARFLQSCLSHDVFVFLCCEVSSF